MSYPLLNAFLTMLWFFLWVLWIWLLVKIISDIFRSGDLSGWGKAGWLIFVIVLPFLGVFAYVLARGKEMGQRELQRAELREDQLQDYIRKTAGSASAADELVKLADLKNKGAISEGEYQQAKSKVLV